MKTIQRELEELRLWLMQVPMISMMQLQAVLDGAEAAATVEAEQRGDSAGEDGEGSAEFVAGAVFATAAVREMLLTGVSSPGDVVGRLRPRR